MVREALEEASWPSAKLGEAFDALVAAAGIQTPHHRTPVFSGLEKEFPAEVAAAAERIGCEITQVECNWLEVEGELIGAAPGLIAVPGNCMLATLRARGQKLQILQPDLRKRWVRVADICQAIREPAAKACHEEVSEVLRMAGVSNQMQASIANLLGRDRLAGRRFDQAWILRPGRGAEVRSWLQQAATYRNAAVLAVAHAAQYVLWLLSWVILGSLAIEGRMDFGWLLSWAAALLTIIPIRFLGSRAQGALAIGLAGLLKRRLFGGVLRLSPDEIKAEGAGGLLGRVFESENVEALAINGAIQGLLATIELAVAAAVLGRYSMALLAWCLVAGLLAWLYLRLFRGWAKTRMELTGKLVESMLGHRTRLVQQSANEWRQEGDRALAGYADRSRQIDWSATLLACVPRAWLLTGIACLAPGVVSGVASGVNQSTQLAALLGAVLLAFGALRRFAASLTGIAGAVVSWQQISPLFSAASRQPRLGEELPADGAADTGSLPVIEAHQLGFRYGGGKPLLQNVTLTVRTGDRLLLEGPSGGGKSTLASLIAGMREPQAGLLLSGGLDRQTLGEERWRKRIASAPQFQDNHVLTDTFAFNLLMGRCWPPQPGDLEEAEMLCRQLGLGDLLDRMPAGMLQMVGDCGWRLSHGEKSRLFMARALLQKAQLVVLDESFAALDPQNMERALQCAFERAGTLMVIAHP